MSEEGVLGKRMQKGPLAPGAKWGRGAQDSPRGHMVWMRSTNAIMHEHAVDSKELWGEGAKAEIGACVKVCQPCAPTRPGSSALGALRAR